jgi:hypothetical protein
MAFWVISCRSIKVEDILGVDSVGVNIYEDRGCDGGNRWGSGVERALCGG